MTLTPCATRLPAHLLPPTRGTCDSSGYFRPECDDSGVGISNLRQSFHSSPDSHSCLACMREKGGEQVSTFANKEQSNERKGVPLNT